MFGIPTWAVLDPDRFGSVSLLSAVSQIQIFSDDSFQALIKATTAAKKFTDEESKPPLDGGGANQPNPWRRLADGGPAPIEEFGVKGHRPEHRRSADVQRANSQVGLGLLRVATPGATTKRAGSLPFPAQVEQSVRRRGVRPVPRQSGQGRALRPLQYVQVPDAIVLRFPIFGPAR